MWKRTCWRIQRNDERLYLAIEWRHTYRLKGVDDTHLLAHIANALVVFVI